VNPYMLEELNKIAAALRTSAAFAALDKLADLRSGQEPAAAVMSPASQTLQVPDAVKPCPKCGNPVKVKKPGANMPPPPLTKVSPGGDDKALDVGETGGPAAVNEELSEGSYQDTGKYAYSAATPAAVRKHLTNPALHFRGRPSSIEEATKRFNRATQKFTLRHGLV